MKMLKKLNTYGINIRFKLSVAWFPDQNLNFKIEFISNNLIRWR